MDDFTDSIARGGVDPIKINKYVDRIIGNFVKAKIGIKPVIFLKQLSSIPASAVEIPVLQFFKYLSNSFIPSKYEPLLDSRLVKSRGKGFSRDVRAVLRKETAQRVANKAGYKDNLMFLARKGDIYAILGGGVPVYHYHYDRELAKHNNKEKAHLFALEKFEASAEKWQQSGQVKNLSNLQKEGSVMKMFTMFLNSPIQYMQQGQTGIRNLLAGRGKKRENIKRTLMAYFVLQATFNVISAGFRMGLDDDDRDLSEFFVKLMFSAGRGIPIFGSGLEWLRYRLFTHQITPLQSVLQELAQAGDSVSELFQEGEENTLRENVRLSLPIFKAGGTFLGLPFDGAIEPLKGAYEVSQGIGTDKVTMAQRVIGYTPYALYGGKNNYTSYLIKHNLKNNLGEKQLRKDLIEWYDFQDLKAIKYKPKIKSDIKRYNIRKEFGYSNTYSNQLLDRGLNNEDKVDILLEAREELGKQEFKKLRRRATKKKLISKPLNKMLNKEFNEKKITYR